MTIAPDHTKKQQKVEQDVTDDEFVVLEQITPDLNKYVALVIHHDAFHQEDVGTSDVMSKFMYKLLKLAHSMPSLYADFCFEVNFLC
jgi:hypothetical protein